MYDSTYTRVNTLIVIQKKTRKMKKKKGRKNY